MSEPDEPSPEDAGPASGHGGGDRDAHGATERLVEVAEKLLDNLDLAASFVLDSVQHRILEPLEEVRRMLLLGMMVFLLLGLGSIGLAIYDRQLFLTLFPYFFGTTMLIVAAGLFALDQQAKQLKEKIREMSRKARKWKQVASWARSKL